MHKNEQNNIEKYLNKHLMNEENCLFNEDVKIFYNHNKIKFELINFSNFYQEDFFIILKIDKYAIYFNDVEECFGICEIKKNECIKYADFFDTLAPTVQKFKIAYDEGKIENLFS